MPAITTSFDIELTETVSDFEKLEEILQNKFDIESEIAILFAEELEKEVSQTLYDTKEAYIEAISVQGNEVIVDTSDFVVGMVEEGVDRFDMKEGFLNKPNVKKNKQGKKYAAVPVSKFKRGKYNWRDRETGRFSKGTNIGGDVEFRVISENSDPDSWIHPGYKGNFFVDKTMESIGDKIEELIDNKIDKIFSE